MTLRFSCGPMGLAYFDPDYRGAGPSLAPPQGWRALDGDDVQRLHELYYDPAVPVSAIAPQFGVSGSTLLRWISEMGWPSRRALRRQSCETLRSLGPALRGAGEDLAPDSTADDFDAERMRDAIAAAVQREVALVQSALDADEDGPEGRERHARALLHLVQALRGLRALNAGADVAPLQDDGERPARSIAELRMDLAERLDRLRAGEEDTGV